MERDKRRRFMAEPWAWARGGAIVDGSQFVARLHLIGLDAALLRFEFADREHLNVAILLLRGLRQALLQFIDARPYRADPLREAAIARR